MDRLRAIVHGVLPEPVYRKLQALRNPVAIDDFERAREFKREFFWAAFKALDFNGIDGDYVEFGSHGGATFRLAWDQIARRQLPRHLWACDSFAGLPDGVDQADVHPKWQRGAMATSVAAFRAICRRHGIPQDRYSLIEGYYEESLASLKADEGPTNIALAYVDCDLYSSTRTVLEFLRPRLKHGMVIAFDDYWCWSKDHPSGERTAMLEAFGAGDDWRLVPYRDYGWAGASFVVERATPGSS